jgi:uncharacterized membrane protein
MNTRRAQRAAADAKADHDLRELEGQVKRLNRGILFTSIALAVAIVVVYRWNFQGTLSNAGADWGQFGDYVGGVLNPIFGLLALIALLFTISLQSRELRVASIELARSSEALDAQNETLSVQRFEATFFQLLRLHNDIVNALKLDTRGAVNIVLEKRGRDVLSTRLNSFRAQLATDMATDDIGKAMPVYEAFYKQHENELGHYYRLLYHIIKFVHSGDVENKKFYSDFVRAQMSSDELRLVFFYGLSRSGNTHFKPLLEKYALLKNLPEGEFPGDSLRRFYDPSAYAPGPADPQNAPRENLA